MQVPSRPSPVTDPAEGGITYSVIIPVYGNADTLREVVARLGALQENLDGALEAVFVVDGSPDSSLAVLRDILPAAALRSQLLSHSRNFGSFAAIKTGIVASRGSYLGVMAADLQEPVELMGAFFAELAAGRADVVVGRRERRADPGVTTMSSKAFWWFYRKVINRDIPRGGVDVFGCTREVAEDLVSLNESQSSLVGLLYWVGYRRHEVPYERLPRPSGRSAWTFRKRLRYLMDSVFAFTNIPIMLLLLIGAVGSALTAVVGLVVLVSWLTGHITEPGYTPLMITMAMSTFSLLLGLGIVGAYVARTYENSKSRPHAITMRQWTFDER